MCPGHAITRKNRAKIQGRIGPITSQLIRLFRILRQESELVENLEKALIMQCTMQE